MSTAYLFLHGFGGGTHELLYLENILKAHGAEVYNQNIIGHGKDKKELSLTNHIDWLRYAEDIFDNLRKKHDNIIVIGFSMGGILGLNLAATRKIEKLVLINTPMFVWNIPVIIKDVLIPQKGWALKMRLYKKYAFNSSIKSCLDFTKLLKIARKLPEKVHCEALILQCAGDETTKPKSADYIMKNIGGEAACIKIPQGRHQVFLDCETERELVANYILNFLNL